MSEAKEPKPPLQESGIRWLWVSALMIVLDQLTKFWIVATMPGDRTIHVLPVFDIIHTVNPGAAWSMGANTPGARWVFTGVAVGVSVMLVAWLRGLAWSTHKLLITGLTLILGGAIGNVIDRVRLGHVIDFLLVHWKDSYFPAFNVADSAICIGAGLVVIDSMRDWLRERAAKREAEQRKLAPGVEGGGDR